MSAVDPDRWLAVSAYLDQALSIADDDARSAWVDALAQQRPDVAHDVRVLLQDHQAAIDEGFLEHRPLAFAATPQIARQVIGHYTLIAPIGRGGMGTIWLAERNDGRFSRRAAVKFLDVALANRGEERFRREGTFLARLTHPNIAQLLDAGVTEPGQPYLVIEYVDGEPIDAYCEGHALGLRARLELFLAVLSAVAHAHANLIVHRDIKPSNVFVSRDGVVKLLDFGIAKLVTGSGDTEATLLTRDGNVAMTPEYAAPEQVTASPVTTATDVYALGVLLHLLLTGSHPAGPSRRSTAELVKAIIEVVPPPPSVVAPPKLRRFLHGDLDVIIGKALKKDPAERYGSVTAFADDLKRHLRHEPIAARPDTFAYHAAKFVRRNRVTVSLAALTALAIAAGATGTYLQARTARVQHDFALRQLARAEAVNDLNTFVLSDAAPSGKPFTVDDLLARAEQIVEHQPQTDATHIQLLLAIGHQYTVQDEYGKAARLLENAYALARRVGDRSARATAACTLAQTLASTNDLARAEALISEGLTATGDDATSIGDRVFCLERGAEVAVRRNAGQEAIARATAAQRLVTQLPARSALADVDADIAVAGAYSTAGQHGKAAAAFNRALEALTKLGRQNTARAATVYNNLGVSLTVLGRPLEAERALARAIAISRESTGDEAVSPMLLVNYARALDELGRPNDAAAYAERADDRATQIGAGVVSSQAGLLRASIYRHQGKLDQATRILARTEEWLKRNLPPGHIALGALASQQSLVADARGDLADAHRLATTAVDVAASAAKTSGSATDYLVTFLVRRSQVELEQRAVDDALADAQRGVAMLRSSPTADVQTTQAGRAYLALARALGAAGRRDEARRALSAAIDHLQSAAGAEHPETRDAREELAKLTS